MWSTPRRHFRRPWRACSTARDGPRQATRQPSPRATYTRACAEASSAPHSAKQSGPISRKLSPSSRERASGRFPRSGIGASTVDCLRLPVNYAHGVGRVIGWPHRPTRLNRAKEDEGMTTSHQLDATAEGRPCPYCRFPMTSSSEPATCENCGSVHHAVCWTDNGGCAAPGCGHAPADRIHASVAPVPAASQATSLEAVHQATEVFADLGGGTAGFATAFHLLRSRWKRKRKHSSVPEAARESGDAAAGELQPDQPIPTSTEALGGDKPSR